MTWFDRLRSRSPVDSKQQWKELFDQSPVMYFILDAAGTVLAVNALGAAQLGYKTGELVGQSVLKVFFAEDQEAARHNVALCLQRLGQQNNWEIRKVRKDGSLLWVRENAKAVRRWGKDPIVLIACEDITDRKRAEERLRESEKRFRDYAETASDWFWESGPDHRFTQISDSEQSTEPGMYFKHAVGATRWDLASDRDEEPEKWRAHIETLEAREAFRGFTYKTIRSDGSAMYVSSSGKPIFDQGGRFLGYRGVSTDISATVRADHAEQALREVQTELAHVTRVTTLGELAASIAHEINQPLGAIVTDASACLRWLDRDTPNLAEARETLGRIIRDANRASDVIGRIRALTRNAPILMGQLDINEVIRDVVALTRREMERNRIALQTQLAADLPMIRGDRVQLQQVTLNLIVNAIEAMGSDGPRDLLVASKKDEYRNVLVVVQDSGPGLDPGSIDRIFDAFYTTKSSGMGMGLAICRSIVETHGGRLWANSNPSRGACFQFALPADLSDGRRSRETITPSANHNTP